MAGIIDLNQLLTSLLPSLTDSDYVFCTTARPVADFLHFEPVATFREPEGTTLILEKVQAQKAGLAFEGTYRQIILTVHSSLEAVGLTAAVATKLAEHGISANVVAAYYHDHIFVPSHQANQALEALKELSQ